MEEVHPYFPSGSNQTTIYPALFHVFLLNLIGLSDIGCLIVICIIGNYFNQSIFVSFIFDNHTSFCTKWRIYAACNMWGRNYFLSVFTDDIYDVIVKQRKPQKHSVLLVCLFLSIVVLFSPSICLDG